MPFRQVKTIVKQPIGAGFGKPARFFPYSGKVNVPAVGNFFKTVFINFTKAAPAIEKTTVCVGKADFAANFDFVQAAFAAAVAKPIRGASFLQVFSFSRIPVRCRRGFQTGIEDCSLLLSNRQQERSSSSSSIIWSSKSSSFINNSLTTLPQTVCSGDSGRPVISGCQSGRFPVWLRMR